MKMKSCAYTLFYSIIFLLISCGDKSIFEYTGTIALDKENNSIHISNPKNKDIVFDLNINDKFPILKDKMIETIKVYAKEYEIPKYLAAYHYVINHTYHSEPITSDIWQHNPEIFINAIGGGFCDDLATVLVDLWIELGYEARVIGLEGHVVAEVKDTEGWHMLDPDLRVIIRNKKGSIYSVNQLEENPNLIGEYINKTSITKDKYSPSLKNHLLYKKQEFLYGTKVDNNDISEWHLKYENYHPSFILPANSSLNIGQWNERDIAIVNLNRNSKGTLQIPLLPQYIEGKVSIEINNEIININENEIFTFEHDKYISKFKILKVSDTAKVIYTFNPKLDVLARQNNIDIISSDSIVIENQYLNFHFEDFLDKYYYPYIVDKYEYSNLKYFEIASEYNNEGISKYLINELDKFLKLSKDIDSSDQKEINKKLSMFLDSNILKEDNLEFIYPILNYYLFLGLKYGEDLGLAYYLLDVYTNFDIEALQEQLKMYNL